MNKVIFNKNKKTNDIKKYINQVIYVESSVNVVNSKYGILHAVNEYDIVLISRRSCIVGYEIDFLSFSFDDIQEIQLLEKNN